MLPLMCGGNDKSGQQVPIQRKSPGGRGPQPNGNRMDYPQHATQRIDYLKGLLNLLESAPRPLAAPVVTLNAKQRATLVNLVDGELCHVKHSLKKHLEVAEVVRKLQAGERLSDAEVSQ